MARKLIDDIIATQDSMLDRGREVISMEADALHILAQALDDSFIAACRVILEAPGRIVLTGLGKSGHVARKIAATFAATGTPAVFVHASEAAHGDLGMIAPGDRIVIISNSGSTPELRHILAHARLLDLPVIGIGSRRDSPLMKQADVRLILPSMREACSANVAPTTSTALQMAMGDALAMAVMDRRGISRDSLRSLHPGGAIGLRLTPVRDIMHGLERLPMVAISASMPEAILAMTSGGFGIAGVLDDRGDLAGVITDGDLRRHFRELPDADLAGVMTRAPKTIPVDMIAQDALLVLNENKITAAFVVERRNSSTPARPVGIVHIHDFVRLGLG